MRAFWLRSAAGSLNFTRQLSGKGKLKGKGKGKGKTKKPSGVWGSTHSETCGDETAAQTSRRHVQRGCHLSQARIFRAPGFAAKCSSDSANWPAAWIPEVSTEPLRGEVLEWKSKFGRTPCSACNCNLIVALAALLAVCAKGWIKASTSIDHPLAEKRQGKIYINVPCTAGGSTCKPS